MHLKIREIFKYYGSVHANDGISLEIQPGTILGVLGENGAGKSTLMKILSGEIEKDSGEIWIDNRPVKINSPSDALEFGIGMLHQDPHDFPSLSIHENLLIDTNKRNLNSGGVIKSLDELMQNLGFSIDLSGMVNELSVGERQQLELLRLLWRGSQLMILDEPTTGISKNQKETLFSALQRIADEGKSVIFVSHKLDEIQSLCHKTVVLRRGKLVGELSAPFNQEELVELMFGKKISRTFPKRMKMEDFCLEVKDLAIDDFRMRIERINLEIQKGEVLGLAGMAGSGQRMFLRVLAGLEPSMGGSIIMGDEDLSSKSCFYYQQKGIFYVPSARLEEGLMPGMSLHEHVFLSNPCSPFIVNKKENILKTEEKITQFKIVGHPTSLIEELSGGNQQRMLLALQREEARLLLLENPTRGLDIESANWIWSILRKRCEEGAAIIFSSADLEELLFYSDRILVFFSGSVSPAIPVSELDENQLGNMIGGWGWDQINE